MRRALIAALFALAFPATAHAEEGPRNIVKQIPVPGGLEKVAREYWSARDVTLPPTVNLYETLNDRTAAGWGDEPGTDVYLTRMTLYGYPRTLLCGVYLHERGHNAGLSHASPDPAMSAADISVPPRCITWSGEYLTRNAGPATVRKHRTKGA